MLMSDWIDREGRGLLELPANRYFILNHHRFRCNKASSPEEMCNECCFRTNSERGCAFHKSGYSGIILSCKSRNRLDRTDVYFTRE